MVLLTSTIVIIPPPITIAAIITIFIQVAVLSYKYTLKLQFYKDTRSIVKIFLKDEIEPDTLIVLILSALGLTLSLSGNILFAKILLQSAISLLMYIIAKIVSLYTVFSLYRSFRTHNI